MKEFYSTSFSDFSTNNDVVFAFTRYSAESCISYLHVLIDKRKIGLEAILAKTMIARCVGRCSHIATLLWYFGFARFHSSIDLPADFPTDYFQDDSISEE